MAADQRRCFRLVARSRHCLFCAWVMVSLPRDPPSETPILRYMNSCCTYGCGSAAVLSTGCALPPLFVLCLGYGFSPARSPVGNAHPPLYELLLHVWLRISGGAFDWLRAPAIVCFVLGLWFLSR